MYKKSLCAALSFFVFAMIFFTPKALSHSANVVFDSLSNTSKLFSFSSGWGIDTSNPSFFGGDTARLTRATNNTQHIVYQMVGMKHFAAEIHSYAASSGLVKFYVSSNNITWDQIQVDASLPVSSGDPGWTMASYSPRSVIPSGIQYLKIEFSGDVANWLMQIGSVTITDVAATHDLIKDELTNTSKLYSYSSNMTIDSTNPLFFAGDTQRATKTNTSLGYISYHLHDIKNVELELHNYTGFAGTLKVYVSSDHSTWSEIAMSSTTPIASGDPSWKKSTYSSIGTLASGMHYVKLEIYGGVTGWGAQIGRVEIANFEQGDYYVDSVGGNDSHDGRTAATAWKTFTNINGKIFAPGDRILLKSGGVWNEQLFPRGSGTEAEPITLSSYGIGNRPIINGNGLAGGAVYLRNSSHWIIENLEVTNDALERGNVYRSGIFIENMNGGILNNIQILNNYVHDVKGSFRYPIEVGFDGGPHAFGGISVYVRSTDAADKFDGVLIEDNMVEDVGRSGIVVWDNKWNGENYASVNTVIRQNYVKQSDSDGILTFGVDGALIEHNIAEGIGWYSEPGQFNGSAAIWPTRGKDNVVQYNEAFNTQRTEGDGQGFNLDMDSSGGIVQYNYSHDNEGGFMLVVDASYIPGVENGSENGIIRYNISQNDLYHTVTFAGGVSENTQIYNNTIYIGPTLNTKIIDTEWKEGGDLLESYYFKNNIVYNLGRGGYQLPSLNGIFDSNLLYGNHAVTLLNDANVIRSNPLFVSQGTAGTGWNTVDGYKLREGSPALGAGVVIANNGGYDYWGNTVSATAAPNIGAYNGPGLAPDLLPPAPIDSFVPMFLDYELSLTIENTPSATMSVSVTFTNTDTSPLQIDQINWSVGLDSGTTSSIAPIAANSSWTYTFNLPSAIEGEFYELAFEAAIQDYELFEINRDIDFNSVLPVSPSSSAVTIDLADGTNMITGYTGASDLSGEIKLRWDMTNFYLTADIVDDTHAFTSEDNLIFQNDGIQFGISPGIPGASIDWYEYGISETPSGPQVYRWLTMQGEPIGEVTSGSLTITRNNVTKITSYQLVLPWSELYPMIAATGENFSFSILVNDNDGAGRKGFIEWGSGIGGTKDLSQYRTIILR